MKDTFYWHDYETWGVNPAIDGPSQFAGVRTDMDLNIIGDPLVIYNQPSFDRLPHPQACAITGITPQHALEHGLSEIEFSQKIHDELNQANTCSVGYNSLRFDDEVTRFMLYRNFYPVYDREWKQGNSRWDLLDVMRLCYAIRPDDIEWPKNEKGMTSFKLESLSKANGLLHEQAHDALSDVLATIALAKLLKEKKPKLFEYAFALRDKKKVTQYLDVFNRKPVLYTSAYFSAEQGCTSLVMPLAQHPVNKNAVIVFDLRQSPVDFLKEDAQSIADDMYRRRDEKTLNIPLMTIQINKSPMLSTTKLLDESLQKRLSIDMQTCKKHFDDITNFDRTLLDLKLKTIFNVSSASSNHSLSSASGTDDRVVDEQLYGGAFFSARDAAQMEDLRMADESSWAKGMAAFQDDRLNELQWRYQARHFPESLSAEEKQEWMDYCLNNPTSPTSKKELSVDEYIQAIDALDADQQTDLKESLREWLITREELINKRYSS